jgi:hypothetical protein
MFLPAACLSEGSLYYNNKLPIIANKITEVKENTHEQKRQDTLIHPASHPSRPNTDEEKISGWIILKMQHNLERTQ